LDAGTLNENAWTPFTAKGVVVTAAMLAIVLLYVTYIV
jgi:hypothetical protein